MSVAFRSASSNQANSTTVSVTPPAGVALNDVVIATVIGNANTGTWTFPTGFTQLESVVGTAGLGGANAIMGIAWKLATASESSYSISIGSGAPLVAVVAAYQGCDPNNPINAHASSASAGVNAGTFNTPTVTTTIGGCGIVDVGGQNNTLGNGSTFTAGSGWGIDAQLAGTTAVSNNPGVFHGHDTSNQQSPGGTTARSVTSSNSGTGWVSGTVALAPLVPSGQIRGFQQAINRAANW